MSCGIRLWDQILKGRKREEGKRSRESEGMLADGSALAKGRQALPVFASRSGHGCLTQRRCKNNGGKDGLCVL